MYNKQAVLVAAAVGIKAAVADFIVATGGPIPTVAVPSFANEQDAIAWASSIETVAASVYAAQISASPEILSIVAEANDIEKKVSDFAATATYSIPSEVFDTSTTLTLTTLPDWYTALPAEVKSWEEKAASIYIAMQSEVVAKANVATTTPATTPTPSVGTTLVPSAGTISGINPSNGTIATDPAGSPPQPSATETPPPENAAPTKAAGLAAGLLAGAAMGFALL